MIRTWRFDPADGHAAGGCVALGERELADPSPDPNSVVVSVEAAVFGRPEYAAMGSGNSLTPGGAAVGIVASSGDNATHLVGRRVVVGPEQPCGECDVCRRGGAAVCPNGYVLGRTAHGALATQVIASGRWIVPIDGQLDVPGPAAALLGREAAWAYAMYTRAGTAPGEPVVIVGEDVVASFIAQIAVARGNRPMVACAAIAGVVSDAVKLELDANADAAALQAIVTRIAMDSGHGARPWKVFDTATGPHRGTHLGGPRAIVTVLSARAVGNGAHTWRGDDVLDADGALLGVAGAHPDLIPEVVAMAVRGEIDVAAAANVVDVNEIPRTADSAGATAVSVVKIPS